MGPKSNIIGVLKRRGKVGYGCTHNSGEGQAKKRADIGVMPRNLQEKECHRLLANTRN